MCADLRAHRSAWLHHDTTRAAEQQWITIGNAIIDPPLGNDSRFITNTEIHSLATQWSNADRSTTADASPGPKCCRCLSSAHNSLVCPLFNLPGDSDSHTWLPAEAFDFTCRNVAETAHAAITQGIEVPLALRIANTELSTSRGQHWFTIAYSITRRSPTGI